MHVSLLLSVLGLPKLRVQPDLASKNTEHPMECEFQITFF